MKIPTRGGFAALAVCAAAAVAAVSPAAAAASDQDRSSGLGNDRLSGAPDIAQDAARQAADSRVPVYVPLEAMETGLPVDAPRLAGTLPATPVLPPEAPSMGPGQLVPDPLLPALGTSGDGPSALLEAPVPTLDARNAASAARVATPSVPLTAAGPEARLGLPVDALSVEDGELPRLDDLPDAGLTGPQAQGQPTAGIGVSETGEQSRLPVNDVVSGTLGTLGALGGLGGGAGGSLV